MEDRFEGVGPNEATDPSDAPDSAELERERTAENLETARGESEEVTTEETPEEPADPAQISGPLTPAQEAEAAKEESQDDRATPGR